MTRNEFPVGLAPIPIPKLLCSVLQLKKITGPVDQGVLDTKGFT